MSDDRREIDLTVEVPVTPEQAWDAIATGPGITAWYVPAELQEREGGELLMDFGTGSSERARVVAWEPPHRLRYELTEAHGRGLAFEFLVEARGGGAAAVRLIASGFGTGEEWDAEFDGMESGFRLFLANLVVYLTHFPGQRAASVIANGSASGPRAQVWERLADAAGLPRSPRVGDAVATGGEDTPALSGVVEWVADEMVTVRVEQPAPGTVFFAAEGGGMQIWTSFYAYFYGEQADATAAREAPRWQSWMAERFPPPPTE